LKPSDNLMLSAYRLSIMIEQDKQKRLLSKSKEFQAIQTIS